MILIIMSNFMVADMILNDAQSSSGVFYNGATTNLNAHTIFVTGQTIEAYGAYTPTPGAGANVTVIYYDTWTSPATVTDNWGCTHNVYISIPPKVTFGWNSDMMSGL